MVVAAFLLPMAVADLRCPLAPYFAATDASLEKGGAAIAETPPRVVQALFELSEG
jgi:hypothetical protein